MNHEVGVRLSDSFLSCHENKHLSGELNAGRVCLDHLHSGSLFEHSVQHNCGIEVSARAVYQNVYFFHARKFKLFDDGNYPLIAGVWNLSKKSDRKAGGLVIVLYRNAGDLFQFIYHAPVHEKHLALCF
jgi:hypothetical protein